MRVPKDRARQHLCLLKSWVHLQKFGPYSALQLRELITVESGTRNRRHMLTRLAGMLHTAERRALYGTLGL